jgi:two-component system chemotaxis response regulator CheB
MMNQAGVVRNVITVGASAGGIEALIDLLHRLPPDLPAVLGVVVHRSSFFASRLDRVLGRRSALPVGEPADGEALREGRVYLAPRDHHLVIADGAWRLGRGPRRHGLRPSVDALFSSAARSHGHRVVGVLLSGAGSDGVAGLIAIKAASGLSIVQDPAEARHPGMPSQAIREDDVDAVLRIAQIAKALPVLAAGDVVA